MYPCTSFRGAKNLKKMETGYAFGRIDKFWKGLDT